MSDVADINFKVLQKFSFILPTTIELINVISVSVTRDRHDPQEETQHERKRNKNSRVAHMCSLFNPFNSIENSCVHEISDRVEVS